MKRLSISGFIFIVALLLATVAVFAVALTPAASGEIRPLLQSLAIVSCSSSSPCQEDTNFSTGPGLEGISSNGKGVVGQTKFLSSSASNASSGVLGQALGTSGFNAGVRGTSANGYGVLGLNQGASQSSSDEADAVVGISVFNRGVHGISPNGVGVLGSSNFGPGVKGGSISGFGVLGSSSSGPGVFGSSTSGVGMQGSSSRGVGVQGSSGSSAGVFGSSTSSVGVEGNSTNSIGIIADSTNGTGAIAQEENNANPALLVVGGEDVSPGPPLFAVVVVRDRWSGLSCGGASRQDIFTIDDFGDVDACGAITATTTPLVIRRTALGQRLVSYATQQSQPTMEDFGEARLVNGQAYIPLESRFAATIDPRATYLVFLTPRGDTNGLYVAQTSPAGFSIRENRGGRSTVAFDYRIVAKPYDTNAPRLPLASSLPHPRPLSLPLLRHPMRPHFKPQ